MLDLNYARYFQAYMQYKKEAKKNAFNVIAHKYIGTGMTVLKTDSGEYHIYFDRERWTPVLYHALEDTFYPEELNEYGLGILKGFVPANNSTCFEGIVAYAQEYLKPKDGTSTIWLLTYNVY